ncbi:MAG: methyltransferase domain-containing protein [Rhodospirillaceae bacterium]|nr:methyltransferase domain-containing protein [Rhodospirillales bacterium]
MSKKAPSPRHVALDLVSEVLDRRRLLDEAFAAHPHMASLEGRDRAFARLLAATTLRRQGQIDALVAKFVGKPPTKLIRHVLRLGVAQLLFLETPPHAAIATSVDLTRELALNGFAGLVNAVLRRVDTEGRVLLAAQDAVRLNIPVWLWNSWDSHYGPERAAAIAAACLTEASLDITVAGDPAAWAERLEAQLLPTGSLRRSGCDITALPGFEDGAWWVQDAAAALPARLLGDIQGKRVADLCAAPGGKTLQLAAAGAQVTAIDLSEKRLRRVHENLARAKLSAEIIAADVAAWQPETLFDGVLLDAPCSATGTLRRHPDGLWLKSAAEVTKLAGVQARLLRAAAAMVRPGGTLLYCVCSLQAEEGAPQIDALLAEGAPFRRKPITPSEIGGLAEAITPDGDLRTLPYHMGELGGMDAFFAARLERLP